MTVKNKTEESKKEKAEPAAAPNDDLVSNLQKVDCNRASIYKIIMNLLFDCYYSLKKTNVCKKSLICWLKSSWYVYN